MFAASFAFVDIKKVDEEVMVTIKPERSIFFKTMIIIFFFPFIAMPIGLLILIFQGTLHLKFDINTLLIFGGATVITIFVYKYLKRNFGVEKLTISKGKLIYQSSFLGMGKYFETNRKDIKKFTHIGFDKQTKHPLEIAGDALNFGTSQGEIDFLNQTGTLLLVTEYHVLKFGLDVDEDDYVRLKQLILRH